MAAAFLQSPSGCHGVTALHPLPHHTKNQQKHLFSILFANSIKKRCIFARFFKK
jgi:hypothetical protein